MTRDYNERLNWVPHPVKNNMCYDTPQLNVTLAIQRAKKSAIFFCRNERRKYILGRLTNIAMRCRNNTANGLLTLKHPWPSAFAPIDMSTYSNAYRRKQALTQTNVSCFSTATFCLSTTTCGRSNSMHGA